MSPTVLRSVSRQYLVALLGVLGAVVTIFLVVDFVDQMRRYTGPNWARDAAVLYALKALVVAHQMAPAAMLLGAGLAVSAVRQRGELTALKALGFPPSALLFPVGALALLVAWGMVLFDEKVVVRAARRSEEIAAQRFNKWGEFGLFSAPRQWFRAGDSVFHLRGGDPVAGFDDATVLTLSADFTLTRRLDATRMEPLGGTRWRLVDVTDRRFSPAGASAVTQAAEGVYDLGVEPTAFRILTGRPEQLRLSQLRDQIRSRQEVGLPANTYALALHNRFAYPLAGLPAALLAVLLAIRPSRKGHVTAALVEGLGVSVILWGVMVACRALVSSERLPPPVAAWLPFTLLVGVSAVLWLRREGHLGGGAG